MSLSKRIKKDKNGDYDLDILNIEKDLYNIAKNILYNTNDIEDIIQETVLNILKNIKKLKDKNNFKSWAIKILLNECKKNNNCNDKQKLIFNKIIDYDKYIIVDNSISDLEDELSFKNIIKILSPIEQNIFIFYYQCNYSIKDIANILNIKENTVKSKLKRCKEKIKKNYVKGGEC